jgi:hypothetical protein
LRRVLQNDGAAKVGMGSARADQLLGKGADVFPQRFPLNLLLPDIGALIQRDNVAPVQAEKLANGDVPDLHWHTPQYE